MTDKVLDVNEALQKLDHDEDAHWTKDGLPNVNVINEMTGKKFKRKDIQEIAPDLVREIESEAEAPKGGFTAVSTIKEGVDGKTVMYSPGDKYEGKFADELLKLKAIK